MFRASSCPSSGAYQLQQPPLIYRWSVLVAVLLVVVGPVQSGPARPRPTALLPPRFNGKPEAATAVIEFLMMGMRMPETCGDVFKRQVINQRNCCIWLVDSFECMMMHGLANPKNEFDLCGSGLNPTRTSRRRLHEIRIKVYDSSEYG